MLRKPLSFERRSHECGQTIALVALSMVVLIAFFALAIDVTTLYIARKEAQGAADAAALAGAKAFVNSGYTSGLVTLIAAQDFATQQARAVALQEKVAGRLLVGSNINVTFPSGTTANPRVTAVINVTRLPMFFSTVLWSANRAQVTATASAEAYNPSGTTGSAIAVGSVKPWAIPNCDPTNSAPPGTNCGAGVASFVDPGNNFQISNQIVGRVLDLRERSDPLPTTVGWTQAGTPPVLNFLAVDIPISSLTASCPSSSQVSCSGNGLSLDPSNPQFAETIACSNSQALSCGQTLNVHAGSGSSFPAITDQQALLCLIHAGGTGQNRGQDQLCNNASLPSCPVSSRLTIDAGSNNPDPGMVGKDDISRSDSVVTVPLFQPSCADSTCANTPVTIVGFLQLGIARVRGPGAGPGAGAVRAMVMNVIGCGSTSGTPISGGGVSPIPVRLVQ
jgi:Putative Flp pilus-assembly TadE/G-like